MQPTSFRQMTLPPLALANDQRVGLVAKAAGTPVRLLIKNPSAATAFFGTEAESMIGPGAPGTDVFEIVADDEKIYVLAPGQKLYGCANAIGAMISITMSEAFPGL